MDFSGVFDPVERLFDFYSTGYRGFLVRIGSDIHRQEVVFIDIID